MDTAPSAFFFPPIAVPRVPGMVNSPGTALASRSVEDGQQNSLASSEDLLRSLSDRFFFPFPYKAVTAQMVK
jgi:hypothetical protein